MAGVADPNAQGATQVNAQGATQLNTYSEIVEAITSSLVLEEVLDEVARRIAKAMDVFACDIHDYDAETNQLTMVSYWGEEITPEDREYVGTSVSLADRPAFVNLIQQGGLGIRYIDDPSLDPVERREMERWGEKSCLTMPLRIGDEVVGILGVLETRFIRRFSDEDVELFKRLAAPAAIAIRNAKIYRQEQQRSRKLASLFEATRAVTSTLVLEDVLALVARSTAEAMGTFAADIYEYSPRDNTMTCTAYWSKHMTREDEEYIGTAISLDERPTYYPYVAAPRLMEVQIDDPTIPEAERQNAEEWGETSALVAPLMYGGQLIGLLGCTERGVIRHFTDEDKELFELLAVPAAVAIHNARVYRQQEEQTRRLASLLDASRAITSTVVLDEVLNLVARKAAEALGSPQCLIYEYDKVRDAIFGRALYDRDGQPYEGLGEAHPLAEYPGDRAILEGGVIVEERVSDARLDPVTLAAMRERGEKTCLNAPLIFGNEPLGLMVLIETEQERHFTPEEVELTRGLAEQAATAIHNARAYAREEKRNRRLVNLLAIIRAIAGSLDRLDVAQRIGEQAASLFPERECRVEVRLRDEFGAYVHVPPPDSAEGPSEESGCDDCGAAAPVVDPGAGAAAARTASSSGAAAAAPPAEPLDQLASEALAELAPRQACGEGGPTRLICPLVFKDAALGYIEILSQLAQPFSEDEVEVVQILATQAATAMENARLYGLVERQAITDGLTGLYNHRYFYERLRQEVTRARRYHTPLSLLMLDLDDFKRVNDEFGHQVGDQVLREVARILLTELRRNVDLAARYGGEEFAILLPNTPQAGAEVVGERLIREVSAIKGSRKEDLATADVVTAARLVGERIRRDIEVTRFTAGDGEPVMHITVSVGVATFGNEVADADALVNAADKALYLAKRLGKNRVEAFH